MAVQLAALASGLSSALNMLGIASGIGLIVSIISGMKPLVSMIGTLVKMLSFILSPIAMVFMTLLYPILLIFKPIVVAMNKIMLPFFKLAMETFKMGAEALQRGDLMGAFDMYNLGAMNLLTGLSVVFAGVSAYVLNMLVNMLLDIVILIIGLFIPGFAEKANGVKDSMNLFFGKLLSDSLGIVVTGLNFMNERAGVNVGNFESDAKSAINEFLIGSGGVEETLTANALDNAEFQENLLTTLFTGENGLLTKGKSLSEELGRKGSEKVGEIINAANQRAEQIVSQAENRARRMSLIGKLI